MKKIQDNDIISSIRIVPKTTEDISKEFNISIRSSRYYLNNLIETGILVKKMDPKDGRKIHYCLRSSVASASSPSTSTGE